MFAAAAAAEAAAPRNASAFDKAEAIAGRKRRIPRERLVGARDSFPAGGRCDVPTTRGALRRRRLSTTTPIADRVPDGPDPIRFDSLRLDCTSRRVASRRVAHFPLAPLSLANSDFCAIRV